ncbi:hypothetical protein BRPE64_ACDS00920 [Caballeronia insecticola]|uniref:Uncharacterized protein n=1 Tax=Caballeronia insecticola TaxID=758793 RepID=R4WSJ4_9BURK|nr:hypothetical protein BRPE64_ACDS00920 [Caballeronia insecticola]
MPHGGKRAGNPVLIGFCVQKRLQGPRAGRTGYIGRASDARVAGETAPFNYL